MVKVEIPVTLEITISERVLTEKRSVTVLRKELMPIQVELPDWVKEIPESCPDIIMTIEVSGKLTIVKVGRA
jgi:hypothetical protein